MGDGADIELMVRARLRALRHGLGLSLGDLAAQAGLSASTISRLETGKRVISLDVLVPLARALGVEVDALLDMRSEDDVVIRPTPHRCGGQTTWLLARPTDHTVAMKMRLRPVRGPLDLQVHPGHDWFFVLHGRVRLTLGVNELEVNSGEAAEFATMTPHAIAAVGGPAELIVLFGPDGHRVHLGAAAGRG